MSYWNKPDRYYTCGCIEEYTEETAGYGDYDYYTITWCDEHKERGEVLKRRKQELYKHIFELREKLKGAEKYGYALEKVEIPERVRDAERERQEERKRLIEERDELLRRLTDVKGKIEII